MKINATPDPGFEKQLFLSHSWWAMGSRWQRMRSCVLKVEILNVWTMFVADWTSAVYIHASALFILLLTYRLQLKRHDCWAWLHAHTHNAVAASTSRWFPILPGQPKRSGLSFSFFSLSFSLSFLSFSFLSVSRQRCDFNLRAWGMFSLSGLSSSPSDENSRAPLVIPFLTLSAIVCLLLQDKELEVSVRRYLATGAARSRRSSSVMLLSLAPSLDFPLSKSAFIDLLLGCN